MGELGDNKKRVRDESAIEPEVVLPEVKRLRDDLLFGFLDESDADPAIQDLDSVMKSLQEEITASSPSQVQIVDLTTSESGESQPELGYLLEASDDELGLPPSTSSTVSSEEVKNNEVTELVRVSSESSGIGELWGFEDNIPSYDSFELGICDINNVNDYVAFDDGLFEYSNVYFDSAEISDFSWRHETLPAE
ncbi:Carbohydrate-responsive element-binding protein [Melia azedarach]|uniref:Carbohydrate-responsive element-binding protein n=1 Tax=Melia azedarach TaxID=155640 RepID=A0ACC1XGM0_MELAZ|nr:Carbohydrate-responsive element-binding protein [Melia azedarach]